MNVFDNRDRLGNLLLLTFSLDSVVKLSYSISSGTEYAGQQGKNEYF